MTLPKRRFPGQEPILCIRLTNIHPGRPHVQQFDTISLHCCHVSCEKGQALPFSKYIILVRKKIQLGYADNLLVHLCALILFPV